MRTAALVLAGALALAGTALAGEHLAFIWSRFDHSEHDATFRKHGVGCPTCHAVGAPAGSLAPPPGVCHGCHAPGQGGLGAGDGLRAAPGRCSLCHPIVAEPESHGPGWLTAHGADARADGRSCADCHTRSSCVDCHDRRQNGSFTVHDPSWIRTHGIAVRAAPSSCDGCHTRSECLACHDTPSGFGRTP